MSLILEALKKVERERAVPEQRGFLVIGQETWAPSRSKLPWIAGMIGAAALAGILVFAMTRPAATPTAAMAAPAPVTVRDFHLEAISARDGVPVAVINQKVVRAGDAVDGARVLRIGTMDVEVDVDGTRRTLRF